MRGKRETSKEKKLTVFKSFHRQGRVFYHFLLIGLWQAFTNHSDHNHIEETKPMLIIKIMKENKKQINS